MRKDQLVKALLSTTKAKPSSNGAAKVAAPARRSSPAKTVARPTATVRKTTNSRVQRHISQIKAKLERSKNLASENGKPNRRMKERIVVMVRDPYWLHAYWEVKRQSVERVQAAMSQDWHTAPYCGLLKFPTAAIEPRNA
jgi:hypothetical protein